MGPEDTTDFSTGPTRPEDALAEDSKFGVLTPMPFQLDRHLGAKETA